MTWSDRGRPLLCSVPSESRGPAPSAIDPAVTRDPDSGDVWLSFGGGHIYTAR